MMIPQAKSYWLVTRWMFFSGVALSRWMCFSGVALSVSLSVCIHVSVVTFICLLTVCLHACLVSLCQASQVSHAWSHMATEPRLWISMCRQVQSWSCVSREVRVILIASMKEWLLSEAGERKQQNEFAMRDGTKRVSKASRQQTQC